MTAASPPAYKPTPPAAPFRAAQPTARETTQPTAHVSPTVAPAAAPRVVWSPIESAPGGVPLYLTADPATDPDGWLCYLKTTRKRVAATRKWETTQFWAAVLTHKPLPFEPKFWRDPKALT